MRIKSCLQFLCVIKIVYFVPWMLQLWLHIFFVGARPSKPPNKFRKNITIHSLYNPNWTRIATLQLLENLTFATYALVSAVCFIGTYTWCNDSFVRTFIFRCQTIFPLSFSSLNATWFNTHLKYLIVHMYDNISLNLHASVVKFLH